VQPGLAREERRPEERRERDGRQEELHIFNLAPVLRASYLPQIGGTMSLVGPRQEASRYVALYAPEKRRVLDLTRRENGSCLTEVYRRSGDLRYRFRSRASGRRVGAPGETSAQSRLCRTGVLGL